MDDRVFSALSCCISTDFEGGEGMFSGDGPSHGVSEVNDCALNFSTQSLPGAAVASRSSHESRIPRSPATHVSRTLTSSAGDLAGSPSRIPVRNRGASAPPVRPLDPAYWTVSNSRSSSPSANLHRSSAHAATHTTTRRTGGGFIIEEVTILGNPSDRDPPSLSSSATWLQSPPASAAASVDADRAVHFSPGT